MYALQAQAREALCATQETLQWRLGPKHEPVPAQTLRSLRAFLEVLPDFRKRRGQRYRIACCMTIMIAARLAGYRGVTAFGEFAARLDEAQLKAVGAFWSPSRQRYTAPAPSTGVAPVWWTPEYCAQEVSTCRKHIPPTRRSTGVKWSSWFARAARPGNSLASSSVPRRRPRVVRPGTMTVSIESASRPSGSTSPRPRTTLRGDPQHRSSVRFSFHRRSPTPVQGAKAITCPHDRGKSTPWFEPHRSFAERAGASIRT